MGVCVCVCACAKATERGGEVRGGERVPYVRRGHGYVCVSMRALRAVHVGVEKGHIRDVDENLAWFYPKKIVFLHLFLPL